MSVPLADVVAALVSAAAVVALVRVWQPRRTYADARAWSRAARRTSRRPSSPSGADRITDSQCRRRQGVRARTAIIIAVFVVCQIRVVKKLLDKATITFHWPGLDVVDAERRAAER